MKCPRLNGGKRLIRISLFLASFFLLGFPLPRLLASSASPFPVRVTQPDGTIFQVPIRGDEHQGWVETEAGFTVTQNPDNDF